MSNINFENTTTPAISLMCKKHDYEYNVATGTFVTGDWVISEKKQRELLGEKVTLTEFSQSEAYMGGRITGFIPIGTSDIAIIFPRIYSLVDACLLHRVLCLGYLFLLE